jgi:hypothetical protein
MQLKKANTMGQQILIKNPDRKNPNIPSYEELAVFSRGLEVSLGA